MHDIVDDVSPRIVYAGNWRFERSSTRQWGEGSIHITSQVGATASFRFRGDYFRIHVTIPPGTATSAGEIQVDGRSPIPFSVRTGSAEVYDYILYESGKMSYGDHTIHITNRGRDDFRLDRFFYECLDEDGNRQPSRPSPPAPPAPAPPPSPSPRPQPQPPQVQPPPPTNNGKDGSTSDSSSGVLVPSVTISTQSGGPASTAIITISGSSFPTVLSASDRIVTQTILVPSAPAAQDSSAAADNAVDDIKPSHELSAGGIAGIAIAVILAVLGTLFLCVLLRRRAKMRRRGLRLADPATASASEGTMSGTTMVQHAHPGSARSFWFPQRGNNDPSAVPVPYNVPPEESTSPRAANGFYNNTEISSTVLSKETLMTKEQQIQQMERQDRERRHRTGVASTSSDSGASSWYPHPHQPFSPGPTEGDDDALPPDYRAMFGSGPVNPHSVNPGVLRNSIPPPPLNAYQLSPVRENASDYDANDSDIYASSPTVAPQRDTYLSGDTVIGRFRDEKTPWRD